MFQLVIIYWFAGLFFLNALVNYSRFIANEFNVGIIYINIQTRWIDSDITDMEGNIYIYIWKLCLDCDFVSQKICMVKYIFLDDAESTSAFKEQTYIEKRNRCLGRYWEQIPALVLQLEKYEDNSKESESYTQIKISVLSSNAFQNENGQCILKLSSVGIT